MMPSVKVIDRVEVALDGFVKKYHYDRERLYRLMTLTQTIGSKTVEGDDRRLSPHQLSLR